jgi:kynurenine formamidase
MSTPQTSADLLRYDELPPAELGGRSAWGQFGAEDNLGTINLLTPERVAAAARLVTRGAVFALNAPVDRFGHVQWGRKVVRHEIVHEPGGIFFDDLLHDFALQGSSQWDCLGHVGYRPGVFYNGATEDEIASGKRNTIDRWAERGIVGRAVLLDMPATMRELGRPYDPSSSTSFGVAELEAARKRAGVQIEPGDILLLHTGFGSYFGDLSVAERSERPFVSPGLEHTEDVVRYLWDLHIAAIASDNLAIESWPIDMSEAAIPWGALHNMLIGQLGLALGELWALDELVADCAQDGRYEMLLVSAPLNVPAGMGSPANAVAIK